MTKMKNMMLSIAILGAMLTVVSHYSLVMAQTDAWKEDFLAPVLDPSWTVLSDLSPNHYSLTDRPGYLRYYLAPGTHTDSWPVYVIIPCYNGASCKPSVVILRHFNGKDWVLRTKVTYNFTQVSNGRQQYTYIIFKHSDTGKLIYLQIVRDNDIDWWNRNSLGVNFINKETGSSINWGTKLPQNVQDTWYFEITRSGRTVSMLLSQDGQQWSEPFAPVTMDSDPGDEQTITLEGASFFVNTGSYADYDYIYVEPSIIPIAINIKPGNVPVAILSSATFDATTVDRSTVEFAGAHPLPNYCSQLGEIPEDVDGDGLLDIVFYFKTQDLNLPPGDMEACLTGRTFSGQEFRGCGSVCRLGPVVGDLDSDYKIDFKDFAIFVSHWLECTDPNCP